MDDIDIVGDSNPTPAPPLHGRGAAADSAHSAALRENKKVTHLRVLSPTRSDWQYEAFGLGVL